MSTIIKDQAFQKNLGTILDSQGNDKTSTDVARLAQSESIQIPPELQQYLSAKDLASISESSIAGEVDEKKKVLFQAISEISETLKIHGSNIATFLSSASGLSAFWGTISGLRNNMSKEDIIVLFKQNVAEQAAVIDSGNLSVDHSGNILRTLFGVAAIGAMIGFGATIPALLPYLIIGGVGFAIFGGLYALVTKINKDRGGHNY